MNHLTENAGDVGHLRQQADSLRKEISLAQEKATRLIGSIEMRRKKLSRLDALIALHAMPAPSDSPMIARPR